MATNKRSSKTNKHIKRFMRTHDIHPRDMRHLALAALLTIILLIIGLLTGLLSDSAAHAAPSSRPASPPYAASNAPTPTSASAHLSVTV